MGDVDMISAIVYTSNTGYTKKYAELLNEVTGLPVYNIDDAQKKLAKDSEIIYLGWLIAGIVKGYKKANKNYKVKAVCAVGMAQPCEKLVSDTISQNKIENAAVFYLRGGYDSSKLRGFYKFMMKIMTKVLLKQYNKKSDLTKEDKFMIDLLLNGGDCVSDDNLDKVIQWYEKSELKA